MTSILSFAEVVFKTIVVMLNVIVGFVLFSYVAVGIVNGITWLTEVTGFRW